MKFRKAEIQSRVHKIPHIKFYKEKKLTAYAGIVVFQALYQKLELKARLRRCFGHIKTESIYGFGTLALLFIIHLALGFRRLRGLDYYREDPLVARVIGVRRLPDASTLSRMLMSCDEESVERLRVLLRETTTERLRLEGFARITVDFDGTVQSTKGHAEGTAVGFNKKKKGARSYYPLFATISQTGQFYDMHHRAGNVHDSNGAPRFIAETLLCLKEEFPFAQLESRIDSAFYNQYVFSVLEKCSAEFTCCVPFERFPELKNRIEGCVNWERIDKQWSFFESEWKPEAWNTQYRLIFIRQRKPVQGKGPVQLDLFTPRDTEYDYKVIAINKTGTAKAVLFFHNGRGSQEKVSGEAKQNVALDYIPTRLRVHGNITTEFGQIS